MKHLNTPLHLSLCASVFILLAVTTPWVWGQSTGAPKSIDSAFREWLDEECKRHPIFASQLGKRDYDGLMDDLSPAARKSDRERDQSVLAELKTKFQGKELTRDEQIDLEIWQNYLQYRIWQSTQMDDFANDPRVYLSYCSDSVFGLFTQSSLPKHRNIANAASRMGFVPQVIAAAKQSIQNPPKVLTEIAIKRTEGAISFYEREIFELADESPQLSSLATPARAAAAALKEFKTYLEKDVLPRSTGDWRIGKEKFAEKLAMELDAGLTAQDVIETAESEATRVEREMYYVAKQLWSSLFPSKTLPPEDEAGRRDTIRLVLKELGKSHGTEATLVEDAKATVQRIKDFIEDKRILTLPNPDQCDIILMPEFQRGFSVAYLNPAPPLDPSSKSLYAIAPPPSDWPDDRKEAFLQEYNSAMLQILTIHEAYPGHYVQLDYSNRSQSLVRKVLYSGVFAEGWAVYTEQMMLDQGYGEGDLSLRLHQLKFYIRAVLNAILDYRMHCTEMTDEEALSLLVDRGFQTTGEAVGKVQRAKQSSCQLSTYFVGRTAFYRLRQQVQRARGEGFDLGQYHEEVLSHGTLPVKYLPELVK
ncbi:hypothetical protein VN12_18885 [Pirellula sp. SH-Sr6A]|uniref:DUF885 domain-containing protein n=1 Tax=Pirellula sp. SH-Sr6A TaxID=1632865 RepID=UPI00078E8A80|nr:DUF885 domain-containing protein [Pirellula sp. SH-Sr6A]AMV34203.1 hypothetical protein VN12_18885 [Pirellula sp. SH-Sr6A]